MLEHPTFSLAIQGIKPPQKAKKATRTKKEQAKKDSMKDDSMKDDSMKHDDRKKH